MREKRQSNDLSQSNDVKRKFFKYIFLFIKFSFYSKKEEDDILRQAVEHEYTTLYRKIHKAAQKTAR